MPCHDHIEACVWVDLNAARRDHDDSLGRLPRLIEQLQISRIGDVGWGARGIDSECSPVLALWPICWFDEIVE